jgi:diguanylate cyclase (GGDEF)-like protein
MRSCAGRPPDLLARYGGEEFVILLPQVGAQGAETVAKRILAAVRALAIPHRMSSAGETVTVSLGVATAVPGKGSCDALVRTADSALYQAKEAGRNGYCVAACAQE